jgi:hypothetical protein
MLGQLDMVGHQEVGLLLVMATVIASAAAADIALVPVMAADGIGIALVVVFADLIVEEHLPYSLRL